MIITIIGFLLCAVVIFFAGRRLTKISDKLAISTGMGKLWIGLILVAGVTSLPELMVGISSSAIVESADLAVGDILGSCAFNLGLLSLMDLFTTKRQPLFKIVSQNHILAAAFGLILITLAGLGIYLNKDLILTPSIGITSFSFVIIYLISIRTIFLFQKSTKQTANSEMDHQDAIRLKPLIFDFIVTSIIIVLSALSLPYFAESIAQRSGLSQSFVGMLFLAVSTSLPEVSVSLASIRSGNADLAVGNLLGSNIFNVFILFIDDLFYTKGHILKDTSDGNLISVFFVILMTTVAIIGFMYPQIEKRVVMAWDTFVIFCLYILNLILLYYEVH